MNHCFLHFDFENDIFYNYIPKIRQKWQKSEKKKTLSLSLIIDQ